MAKTIPRGLARGVLGSRVVKPVVPTSFFVEPTEYGWAVRVGTQRLGLFVSQRQALSDVKKRRADLKARGWSSSLSVKGSETELPPSRAGSSRPMWPRR
jgi:hypothetical protein